MQQRPFLVIDGTALSFTTSSQGHFLSRKPSPYSHLRYIRFIFIFFSHLCTCSASGSLNFFQFFYVNCISIYLLPPHELFTRFNPIYLCYLISPNQANIWRIAQTTSYVLGNFYLHCYFHYFRLKLYQQHLVLKTPPSVSLLSHYSGRPIFTRI